MLDKPILLVGSRVFLTGNLLFIYEPRREKTGLQGFRPGLTKTGQYSYRRRLEA